MSSTSELDRNQLLKQHNITKEEFVKANLDWALLDQIRAHHRQSLPDLQPIANYLSQRLQHAPGVHSLKVRVKKTEHLIAKIIRKKIDQGDQEFTVDSYPKHITDLIGLRALHLFKTDWKEIHGYVLKNWNLNEKPIAYVREGDPQNFLDDFRAQDCEVVIHPFGYRSIHYVLKCCPDKVTYLAELQVRTIFEEGWSEIDHHVRYPRLSSDKYLADFLSILNRLSGNADEMASFVERLKHFSQDHAEAIAERDKRIQKVEAELGKVISDLKISQKEKDNLKTRIDELKKSTIRQGGFGYISDSLSEINDAVLSRIKTTDSYLQLSNVLSRTQQCSVCKNIYTTSPGYLSYSIDNVCSDCRSDEASDLTINRDIRPGDR